MKTLLCRACRPPDALAQTADALDALARREVRGKAVVMP
jgi:hypothetical protein